MRYSRLSQATKAFAKNPDHGALGKVEPVLARVIPKAEKYHGTAQP